MLDKFSDTFTTRTITKILSSAEQLHEVTNSNSSEASRALSR